MDNKWIWLGLALLVSLGIWVFVRPSPAPELSIKVPGLSLMAKSGQRIFETNCVICHGKHATGTDQGPPLVHKIYEPSHHSNLTFYRAVENGVRAHHWPYGNMPPVAGVETSEVTQIIEYIRELQRANGIF